MLDVDEMEVSVQPPNLAVEVPMAEPMSATLELEYDLKDILRFEGDSEDIEVIDTHWHGIVIAGPDDQTHHIDLRDIGAEVNP